MLIAGGCSCSCHFSYFTTTLPSLHHYSFCRNDFFHFIYSNSWSEHLRHVSSILQRLADAGLTSSPRKVSSACPAVPTWVILWATEKYALESPRSKRLKISHYQSRNVKFALSWGKAFPCVPTLHSSSVRSRRRMNRVHAGIMRQYETQ